MFYCTLLTSVHICGPSSIRESPIYIFGEGVGNDVTRYNGYGTDDVKGVITGREGVDATIGVGDDMTLNVSFVMTLKVSFHGRVPMTTPFVFFQINVCALYFFNSLQIHTSTRHRFTPTMKLY